MDPLSISTSVFAIATLAAQTCSAFSDLRSLCQNLPGRLHAVNNEVADLNYVLFQISLLVNDRACLPESKLSAIPHLLKQADHKLVEIKDIVNQLNEVCRVSEQGRLQALQEDIRTVKANLNIILGASNSQDMMKIRLDIEAISTVAIQSSHQQVALQDNFLKGLAAVDERITRERPPPYTKETYTTPTQSEGMGVRVTPFVVTCRSGCPCVCHLQKKSSSPALLNRVLGRLFVGYAGLPLFSPKCSVGTCRKSRASQVNLEYWFPLGFLSSAIVRIQVGYQPNIGTLLKLDTLRRVPDTAQCVSFALHGDIDGLKYLFEKGLASPRDVSTTRGYSFLIHAGADADYRPIAASDNSPRNKACHFLLEGGLSDTASDALHTITKGGYYEDFIDDAGYTKTHKINEIAQNPGDINTPDGMGRTPLAWAAARGDTRAIVTLLSHGADPNIMDGHTVAVRLLLEAGALTDFRKPGSEKKGSPLNCAARNATDVLLLKSLLDFGADVDSSGTDGKTSLIHAARTDNASFAMLLLEYGANINAISADGSSPLTTAITYNSHNVLRMMLDRWHEYSIAALYADLETIRILAATDHFRMKYDKQYTLGYLGNRLRQRPDLTEDLAVAFDDLLSIINQMPSLGESSERIMESVCVPCLPLRVNSDMDELYKEPNSGCSSDGSFWDALENLPPATDDMPMLEKIPPHGGIMI
ncbi:ankyrin [Aspergillus steynii IBT 23096]|uniref:Ankyrin n=1 Tax=Aspergillus steynii IBT 23096 TaxID=1392250 RepID=A0A2I2G6H6_9EURO|nr:ankyrin [Aspergillus steynii IBT 23096]PLB48481.1 ankyrin [Aspergillus steynii IBT 23096]